MSDFACGAAAPHHPTVLDDAAANAGADGYVHQVLPVSARAEDEFAPRAGVRVIGDDAGQTVAVLQQRNEG